MTGTPGEYQIFLRSTSPNYDPQVFVLNFATSISPCDQDRIVQPIPDSSYGICVTRKYFILFYSLLLKKKIAFFKKKKKKKKQIVKVVVFEENVFVITNVFVMKVGLEVLANLKQVYISSIIIK